MGLIDALKSGGNSLINALRGAKAETVAPTTTQPMAQPLQAPQTPSSTPGLLQALQKPQNPLISALRGVFPATHDISIAPDAPTSTPITKTPMVKTPAVIEQMQPKPIQKTPQAPTTTIRDAIALNETSIIPEAKKYTFTRFSGIKALGRAMGKYQITEGELKDYAEKYLGQKVTAKQFLNSPALQDKYMLAKIERLRSELGMTDDQIFAAHFGGINYNINRKSVQEYIKRGLNHLNNLSKDE